MCHGKNYENIFKWTFSSNIFKGVCCKGGSSKDELCDGRELECSMDSVGDEGGRYGNVLTKGKNHQIFAYCPGLPYSICGVPSGSSAPNLIAKTTLQRV